ncbi:DUF2585 family protein [Agrobacterium rhizogenes]|uniref:DUF2585 domain-containing protein n=1 Tax=Rhizobium rhizogenes TaxID=359 RepID=UPI00115F5BA8|nr:DUF2585 domain-containing protein [Rhizobium rhizogenes]NTG02010.1 DUF2585 family protein [Rhizobium rhizogenes]NTG15358.1 DUF2585 family protein [Rhizobium rhizogenes]NTG22238.1 DUF2585 family protein [Rhizobium rhizogenes]NTH39684.1 DUF2585 family protein [Rhizobium rhizogenes]NTH43540.1 DUF2585 family protein [Rhizobium rhizogenes]
MMATLSDAENRYQRQSFWLIACAVVLLVQIVAEYMMGRVPICTCGYVKLFEPVVNSSGNSQHIADWYTPSHIIHGFLFFGLTHLIMRRKPLSMRLFVAMLIESGWELLENSPIIINRYRAATISLDYVGDSILNSAMDAVFMVVGFLFAWWAPVALTIAIAIFFELLTGWLIRDNLTLNVIMLVWPIEAIKTWQGGL